MPRPIAFRLTMIIGQSALQLKLGKFSVEEKLHYELPRKIKRIIRHQMIFKPTFYLALSVLTAE